MRRGFLGIYALCVILPTIAGTALWAAVSWYNSGADGERYLDAAFDAVNAEFSSVYASCRGISDIIAADRELRAAVEYPYQTPSEYLDAFDAGLRRVFEPYVTGSAFIKNITLYTDSPAIISGGSVVSLDPKSEWFEYAGGREFSLFPETLSVTLSKPNGRAVFIREIDEGYFALIEVSFAEIAGAHTPALSLKFAGERGETLWSSGETRAYGRSASSFGGLGTLYGAYDLLSVMNAQAAIAAPAAAAILLLGLGSVRLINHGVRLETRKAELEAENRRAEYKYLQAQVNPHFLFNTLNAILVRAAKTGDGELTGAISNLSRLLQRVVADKRDTVPLKDEFAFIEKYLAIEKFRFGDKFSYTITLEKEAEKFEIPGLCVQQLVENACKYGAAARREVAVSAEIEPGAAVIRVWDNGAAIPPETLDKIHKSIIGGEQYGGTGLRNIYKRLELTSERGFGFTLTSGAEGTIAEIKKYFR